MHQFSIFLCPIIVSRVNLFATTPVAATGFQTTAAYYTLRGDGLRGSQTYAAV